MDTLTTALKKYVSAKVTKTKTKDKKIWYSAIIKVLKSKLPTYADKNKQLILFYAIKNLEKEKNALALAR
jgi:hypothetical protein